MPAREIAEVPWFVKPPENITYRAPQAGGLAAQVQANSVSMPKLNIS